MDLEAIPAIDHHAHNLLKPEAERAFPFAAAFTEANDPDGIRSHAPHTLFYRRSIRDIAGLLDCEPSEEAILKRREELGPEKLSSLCFSAANLEAVFLDDGFLPEKILPWRWHEKFLPVRRILRIEYLAETLIRKEEDFEGFLESFLAQIDPPAPEVIALKSIAAYRSGLEIRPTAEGVARSRYEALKGRSRERSFRLTDKPFIDFLVTRAMEAAASHGVPLQFHTGFGDPDLDLRLSNPLHLKPLLDHRDLRHAPVILLHAGYPHVRQAGYLASVYPRVHVDTGLAIPFLSVSGMRQVMGQLLELAPFTKLMYSSDAHLIPEHYYLGARWVRKVLSEVLEAAVRDSDLTEGEAQEAARAILAENARKLYRFSHFSPRP